MPDAKPLETDYSLPTRGTPDAVPANPEATNEGWWLRVKSLLVITFVGLMTIAAWVTLCGLQFSGQMWMLIHEAELNQSLGVLTGINWDKLSQIGESFGVLNSLVSALAFAGLIYSVLLQQRELRLQRETLNLTRLEMKESVAAQNAAAVALKRQIDAMGVTARIEFFGAMVRSKDGDIARKQEACAEANKAKQPAKAREFEDEIRMLVVERTPFNEQLDQALKELKEFGAAKH